VTDRWREVLLNAADLIEKTGWTKENFHDGNGYCVVGAISRQSMQDVNLYGPINAVLSDRHLSMAVEKLQSALDDSFRTSKPLYDLVHWNDEIYDTKDNSKYIVDLMRTVARGE